MTRSSSTSETVDDFDIVTKGRLMIEWITKFVPFSKFLNIKAEGNREAEWESFRLFINEEKVSMIAGSERRSRWRIGANDVSFVESFCTGYIHRQVMQHFSKDRNQGTWCIWIYHHNRVQCPRNRWPTKPRLCPRLNRRQCVAKTNTTSWIILHTHYLSWRSLYHIRNDSRLLENPLIVTWSERTSCYWLRFHGRKMRRTEKNEKVEEKIRKWKKKLRKKTWKKWENEIEGKDLTEEKN